MAPQRTMWPSIARANGQVDNWCGWQTYHRHSQPRWAFTRSPRQVSNCSFPVPPRVGNWVGLSTQQVSNLLTIVCSGPGERRTRDLSLTSPILYHKTTAPADQQFLTLFASSYASAVLAVVILSVRPSVRHTCAVLYDNTKQRTADILIPHERAITLVFWHQR